MRSFVFGLLCGALVAAIATAIAAELLRDTQAVHSAPSSANVAVVESRAAVDPRELARKLEGANDRVLAEALDAAAFDRSWFGVSAVAQALRARAAASKVDPLTGLAESAVIGPRAKPVPLLALEVEVARRQLVLALRNHDNAATRLLDHASDEESVRKLVDLFTAEAKPPEYEIVREDAALVLGFGATERGREVLGRAIREGPHARSELAARALGESDDGKAVALLIEILANERDPETRKFGAFGLSFSSALARGDAEATGALARAAKSDADVAVRLVAYTQLGSADLVRAPAARAVLVETIASPSEPDTVRTAAIAAVREYRSRAKLLAPDLVDALFQTLGTEHDGPVRREIARALGEAAPPSRLPELESARASAQDPTVREALEKAIVAVKARGEPPP